MCISLAFFPSQLYLLLTFSASSFVAVVCVLVCTTSHVSFLRVHSTTFHGSFMPIPTFIKTCVQFFMSQCVYMRVYCSQLHVLYFIIRQSKGTESVRGDLLSFLYSAIAIPCPKTYIDKLFIHVTRTESEI